MAESNQYSESPSTSKVVPTPLKKMTLRSKICAKPRGELFSADFYPEENIFCKFCLYSVDLFMVDTIKDHIKSKTHLTKKVFYKIITTEIEDNYNVVEK